MADQVDIKVSPDLIRGIIESKVQAAISEAMASESGIVERVVAAALQIKVGPQGKVSSYSSENKFTYLEWLCKHMIQEAAAEAVKRWAAERQKVLEDEFLRQLQTKKTASALVRACVDGLTTAGGCQWRFSVTVNDR